MECEPPAGTQFFAGASQQTAGLTDPDGDGLYAGSVTLPEGFYDLGAFPVPVAILSGSPEVPNQQTIKDFGEVVLEDGDAFSASVSFCDGGTEPPAPTDPEEPTDECLAVSPNPEECEGYVAPVTPGGSGSGVEIAVVSGDNSNANKVGGSGSTGGGSGSVDANASGSADGNGSVVASGGAAAKGDAPSVTQGGASPVANVLPATGGVLPMAGLVGLAIVAAGFLVRRLSR